MTTHTDLIDEKPRFNASDYQPAKKLNAPEKIDADNEAILTCGLIGFFVAIFGFVLWALER